MQSAIENRAFSFFSPNPYLPYKLITLTAPFPHTGWWGFTFPLGVLAVSTTTIGSETPSKSFSILGTVSPSIPCLFSSQKYESSLARQLTRNSDLLPNRNPPLDRGRVRHVEETREGGIAVCALFEGFGGEEGEGGRCVRLR